MKRLLFAGLPALFVLAGCGSQTTPAVTTTTNSPPSDSTSTQPMATPSETPELPATNYYAIDTPEGRMVIHLSDETPHHRDNFKKLVAEGFYNGTTFHRVIAGFMIQGGDPNSKDDDPTNDGQGGPGYTIPAEFSPNLYHKRGALATARTGDNVNPERRSSGSQFYIVHGTNPIDDAMLDQIEHQLRSSIPDSSFHFSAKARANYLKDGGAPFLDQQYTVFGEVVEGLDVLDKIGKTETARSSGKGGNPALLDQPIKRIEMTVKPLADYHPEPGS